MKEYLDLMHDVLTNGQYRVDRTGVGIYSLFGKRLEFDLSYGLPMITTKRVSFYNILHELIFFLKGDTNIKYLTDKNVHIWDEWADEQGNIGPVYGYQWRSWPSHVYNEHDKIVEHYYIDQLNNLIWDLKNKPLSRRHIVSAWNVADIDKMALPPCHVLFQFYVDNDNKLSCQLYQRSADIFLGLPYNITSYSLLTMLIAYHLGMDYGRFIHIIGDAHIYANHVDQCKLQLTREPYTLPYLEIRHLPDMDILLTPEQINVGLVNYYYHDAIKAEIAI